jgi:hypothetical protein
MTTLQKKIKINYKVGKKIKNKFKMIKKVKILLL